ncbi:MAG: S8 family serine peptidase [Sedimentisphaerales bacterium]|nr:S8 family serine peptidase [Sedimentisphaerales bacterium]
MAATLAQAHRETKQAAWATAAGEGWDPMGYGPGAFHELMAVKGALVYMLKTMNVTVAASTVVDLIRNVPPYSLSGAGQTVCVWDSGSVRASHQEFKGRVSVRDNAETQDHSTHVAGTIAAAGVDARAEGMAPAARIESYDFDEDLAEAARRAMSYADEPDMVQVSNHSYGWVCGWDYSGFVPLWYGTWGNRESDMFGMYDSSAHDWDALCYAAPYYLPFKAAGNDRADEAPSAGARFEYYSPSRGWRAKQYDPATDPHADGWDQGGYDTLTSDATAKNIVTVGVVSLAAGIGRNLSRVTMTDFSSWGPTDDGRVKPDLVAHGVDVYSCTALSTWSYDTYSGTSMSTAAASGTAALLCEFYARFSPTQAMRSATLKALLIHTADDLGRSGPDYCYGWGLINAEAVAAHIQTHSDFPSACKVVEDVVGSSAAEHSYPFFWDGASPIRATLVWTDPPAPEVEGLDNTYPCLINDLDLRVVGPDGTVSWPFVLDPVQPGNTAGVGDNTRDNVEQVLIEAPATVGWYYANVSHKGTLVDERQEYSLLLSGQQPSQAARADISGDGVVDLADLLRMAQSWMGDEPPLDLAPVGGDHVVDMLDFAVLARELRRRN